MRGVGSDWAEEEFQRLAQLIVDTVAQGGTVMDACEKFAVDTDGVRTAAAARFKWNSVLRTQNYDAYLEARKRGMEAMQSGTAPQFDVRDKEPIQMTQRDLIKMLKSVTIVDPETEQLRRELHRVKQERDKYKQMYEALLKQSAN